MIMTKKPGPLTTSHEDNHDQIMMIVALTIMMIITKEKELT